MTWEVKSKGRTERAVIVFTVLGAMAFFMMLETGVLAPGEEGGIESAGLFIFIFFFVLVGIPTLLAVIPRLFKGKIADKVELDQSRRTLTLGYGKGREQTLDFDELVFAFTVHDCYDSLVFFKTFTGTRGQLVTKKLTELIGLGVTVSWKQNQLREIRDELLKTEVERIDDPSRNLALWEKLLSE